MKSKELFALGLLGLSTKYVSNKLEEQSIRAWSEIGDKLDVMREDNKRRNTPCTYTDGVTQEQFQRIVRIETRRIKRIKSFSIDGFLIRCEVNSQSGLSTWFFELDYNDYGHLTGSCWITSENNDSNIPNRLQESINAQIESIRLGKGFIDHKREKKNDGVNHITPSSLIKVQETKNVKSDEKVVNEFSSVDDPSEKEETSVATVAAVLILMFVCAGIFAWYEYSLLTEIPFSMGCVLDKDYQETIADFEEAGFTNIRGYEYNDLSISEDNLENLVVGIKIGWDEAFDKNDRYPSNWPITIYYHTVETFRVPLTSKEVKKMKCTDVINAFEDAGFINIKTEVEYDVITGWIVEVGDVKSVTVNGNEYEEYDEFRADVDVVITYHDLRSNKP